MSAEQPNTFVTLIPVLLMLVIVAWVLVRSGKRYSKMVKMNEEIITLNRDMVKSLQNIEDLLKDRKH
jgi:flagellar biogenesis protein FliO